MSEQKAEKNNLIESLRIPPENYFTLGWGSPEYTDWMDESMSWKQTCYIGDWSRLQKIRVTGPDALKLFSALSVNSFAKFDIGQAKHMIQCNKAGKVIAEGIVMRIGEEEFWVQGGTAAVRVTYKCQTGGYNVTSEFVQLTAFQVSGPNSLFVVEKACKESIRDIKFMHFRKIHIKGREGLALRQGMAGELGYELQFPMEYHQEIYDAVMEAGQQFGIRRLGGRALMVNHLEACFPTTGEAYIPAIFDEEEEDYFAWLMAEFPFLKMVWAIHGSFEADSINAWYRSPVELGWAKNIKFDHEFVGRKALKAEVENPKRLIVTLEWNAEDIIDVYASMFHKGKHYDFMDIPRHFKWGMYADKVLKNGKLVGVTTSRGYSYYFRRMISLCTIDVEYSKPGTEVIVVWGAPGRLQKKIRATVAPAPYKKDNRRIDVTKMPSYLKT